ncbi:uncharacterized protein RHOBADRAFT_56007 [Rhodotorula graminis WP1]|uniref:Uncharacterized protein n=1 Tax=Rhodotorula graminis (strain WP1) TaxID=578459 RepID=A0A0P9F991_RHOGW|nr:uncharacterized protein RHOBADRAFT_56007 [Rhodotorula graminis WP1]KPV72185.1 hypothetical protein RHOBADRAFT_56007 [Rhodotorula graminis WP1]
MAKKRNGQRKHAKLKGKSTKAATSSTKRPPTVTKATAPPPPPHAIADTSLDPAADTEMGGPFHQAAVPLQPAPHAPKTAHRELPRVELEKLRGGDHGASAYSSAASSFHDGYYHHDGPYVDEDQDEARVHPADRKHAAAVEDDDEDDNLSDSFSDSPSFVYTDDDDDASDELDDDDDDEGEYDSSDVDDGGGATKKLDESDERRPFPDPRLAKQHKYLRRTDSDAKSSSTHVDSDHAPRAEAYIESAVPTPVTPRSPASPSDLLPPSYHTAQQPVPSSSSMAKASASHATVHYAPVSGATYDDSAAAAAGYASDLDGFDPLDGPYPRGRSKHPRLLWRSALDPGALAVLDAHHERLRGGPLPRLALELVDVRLSASGVDREREHAPGLEDEEVQERVRRARRRDAAGARRRTWSQAGRQWSREMESIGL